MHVPFSTFLSCGRPNRRSPEKSGGVGAASGQAGDRSLGDSRELSYGAEPEKSLSMSEDHELSPGRVRGNGGEVDGLRMHTLAGKS